MTAERSLQIIREQIEQSRRDIERGSWKSMMLWGTAVTAIALVVGHLWAHSSMGSSANILWTLLGLVGLYEGIQLRRKPKKPDTFVMKNINYVWTSFGIMAGSIGFLAGISAMFDIHITIQAYDQVAVRHTVFYHLPITYIIIFSMGVAGMITGLMLKSRVITICCFLVGAVGSILAVVFHGPNEMLVMAGAAVVGLIVPALVIRTKEKE